MHGSYGPCHAWCSNGEECKATWGAQMVSSTVLPGAQLVSSTVLPGAQVVSSTVVLICGAQVVSSTVVGWELYCLVLKW